MRWRARPQTLFQSGEPCVLGTTGQTHRSLHGGHYIQEDDREGFAFCVLEGAGAA